MKVTLFRDFLFEAAHRNLAEDASATTSRLHGHSYSARVSLGGLTDDQTGWLVDFADIKRMCAPVIEILDHRCLNDVEGMKDTSLPDVTRWLVMHLHPILPGLEGCAVEIIGDNRFNPVTQPAAGRRSGIDRVEFWLAAAHSLPMLPENHKCRRLHGHSFQIAVVSSDIKALLAPLEQIHGRLDHRYLNEIRGLENPTSENLARWLWGELSANGRYPREVIVQETCTTGCVYRGQ
jgi:6-pyruvoyltetrahydropterin/6-carboxytetrahydropterin synthase